MFILFGTIFTLLPQMSLETMRVKCKFFMLQMNVEYMNKWCLNCDNITLFQITPTVWDLSTPGKCSSHTTILCHLPPATPPPPIWHVLPLNINIVVFFPSLLQTFTKCHLLGKVSEASSLSFLNLHLFLPPHTLSPPSILQCLSLLNLFTSVFLPFKL